MAAPTATVKWGKLEYQVPVPSSAAALKADLVTLTGVPLDRQKLMSKAWKGVLKDDMALGDVQGGTVITLMGSADAVTRPVEKAVFLEDLPKNASILAGLSLPSGFVNLGNTCYANSTLQALRAVPELKSALVELRNRSARAAAAAPVRSGMYGPLSRSLADLLIEADNSPEAVAPHGFLQSLRTAYPQFSEQAQNGAFKQQDSEEFAGAMLSALASELAVPARDVKVLNPRGMAGSAANVIDTLFGIEYEEVLVCKEKPEAAAAAAAASTPAVAADGAAASSVSSSSSSSGAAPAEAGAGSSSGSTSEYERVVKIDQARKLQCNIEGGAGKATQINHLHEGIMFGLSGEIEKRSELLGRNAIWTRTARLNSLPKYLCVQMMRFYWKATPESRDHTGVKCKMLRPVAFPADSLDLYDFCSDRVRAVLKVARDKAADENIRKGVGKALGDAAPVPAAAPAAAAAPVPTPIAAAAKNPNAMVTDEDELTAALRMSMEASASSSSSSSAAAATPSGALTTTPSPIGYGLPDNFRGIYELFALVTHKGRSADSGHYMGWSRQSGDRWLVFDDDAVSETTTEYVTSTLKGGGDDHMAVLLFYRAKE